MDTHMVTEPNASDDGRTLCNRPVARVANVTQAPRDATCPACGAAFNALNELAAARQRGDVLSLRELSERTGRSEDSLRELGF